MRAPATVTSNVGRPYKEVREMLPEQIFQVAHVGWWLLQLVVPVVVLVGLPWPQKLVARAIVTVLFVWVASVFYTALVYNPTGIASAIAKGVDSPEMKFDNNTIASTLLGGWIYPAVVVGITILGYRFWRARRRASNV